MKQHDGSMCMLCRALIGDACGKMVRLAIQQGELGEPIPGGSSFTLGSVSGMHLLSSSENEV